MCPLCNKKGKRDYRFAWCKNRFCDLYDLSIPREAWEGSVMEGKKGNRFSRFNLEFGRNCATTIGNFREKTNE